MNRASIFILVAFYVASLLCYLSDTSKETWLFLSLAYFPALVHNTILAVRDRFPLIQYIVFFFYLQNVLCLAILYISFILGNDVDMYEVCNTPLTDYLPFVFLSVQSILIGYAMFQTKTDKWLLFYSDIEKNVSVKQIYLIGIAGLILSNVIGFFGIASLDFVGVMFKTFFNCAVIILLILPNYKYKKQLYIVVAYVMLKSLSTGLIGESISFVLTIAIYLIITATIKGKKIRWFVIFAGAIVGFAGIAFLQNIKGEYRERTWEGNEEANIGVLAEVAEKRQNTFNPTSIVFYDGILTRLNHGGIASSTLNMVPSTIPFEGGSTIGKSLIDAFVPRFLNPDKEKAGGRGKYEKYTGRKLIGYTSMNIGLIGETYINYDKEGSIVFFLFFGIIIALLERRFLTLTDSYPVLFVFVPFLVGIFIQTENDFMIVFNTFVKGTFVIIGFLFAANLRKNRVKAKQSTMESNERLNPVLST